jgi:hypothetical protein
MSGTNGTSGSSGSSGMNGATGATGPASSSVAYNNTSRYRVYSGTNSEIWLVSSSTVYTGLSWTRSGTTITITKNSHGHSIGDAVVVRNVNIDNEWAEITNVTLNTFDIVVSSSSGTSSGDSAAYSLAFTATSVTSSGSTIVSPSGGDVQLLSLYHSTGPRSGTSYSLTLPTSSKNGAGANSNYYNSYFPILRAQNLIAGNTVNLAMTLNTFSNFNIFSLGGLPASDPVGIRAQF